MLYVSKNAQRQRGWSGRTWLAIGYAVAAVLLAILAMAACQAQPDQIDGAPTGARDGVPAGAGGSGRS